MQYQFGERIGLIDDTSTGNQQFGMNLGEPRGHAGADRTTSVTIKLSRPDLFFPKTKPKPSEVFSTYWRFAALRQKIFFARVLGKPESAPFDPIISRHRFTNVYRASDRVSQYLIRNVIYDQNWSNEDLFFRILLFKFFNKIETWEALKAAFGEVNWEDYSFNAYSTTLSRMMKDGERIYSAAYIMPSGKTAFGHDRKHDNHLKIIEMMMKEHVGNRIAQQPNLESVFHLLQRYPCIGPFTGYQYAIDLNYSPLIDFSENDFVEAGPGALDGIAKCFSDPGELKPAELIQYMTDVQVDAFARYAPDFENLWGRPLHLIDCQNLFCEVGKYARKSHPHIKGSSSRTRIKQSYKPSSKKFETPWYPPEWGLNEKIYTDYSKPV